jgi:hypothetical protein
MNPLRVQAMLVYVASFCYSAARFSRRLADALMEVVGD